MAERIQNTLVYNINVSPGSVATRLRFSDNKLSTNCASGRIIRMISIWRIYGHKSGGTFFYGPQCTFLYRTVTDGLCWMTGEWHTHASCLPHVPSCTCCQLLIHSARLYTRQCYRLCLRRHYCTGHGKYCIGFHFHVCTFFIYQTAAEHQLSEFDIVDSFLRSCMIT